MKRSRLKVDPDAVRAFVQRGREKGPLRREKGITRGKGLSRVPKPADRLPGRPKPVEGPLTPAAWRVAVWELDMGTCRGCGVGPMPLDSSRWVWQAHHCVPKQWLRREGLHGHVWDPRNGVVLCTRCHERHESATERVLRDRLPQRLTRFVSLVGERAVDVLDRAHPWGPQGSPPIPTEE